MLSEVLTPRQAAKLVGVSESTIRRWCDSGRVATTRTAGGHRRIPARAVIELAREEGLELVDIGPLATAGRGGRLRDVADLSASLRDQLLSADERDVQQLVQELVGPTGDVARLCDDVVAPAMHRIGEAWASDELRIFREQAATQRALAAVSVLRGQIPVARESAPVAVIAALPGDPYALAPAMCSLVMRSAGFRTTLLGPNTPAEEIEQAAVDLSAAAVVLSVSAAPASPDELSTLCRELDRRGIRVALGGRALTADLRRQLQPDFFGDTMSHLAGYARRLERTLRDDRSGSD